MAMEAAHCAVIDDQTIVIQNVTISWTKRPTSGFTSTTSSAHIYTGVIKADTLSCQERLISCLGKPLSTKSPTDVDDDDEQHPQKEIDYENDITCPGYMCIRYDHVKMEEAETKLPFASVLNLDETVTWIGHCVVVKVILSENKLYYNIHLRLNKSNFDLPNNLQTFQTQKATVEWIPKVLSDR
jgi:hypothetical protein